MAALVTLHLLGNDTAHIILRGGKDGPNYSSEHVEMTCEKLKEKGLVSRVMVDFSHANSEKQFKNQLKVGKISLLKLKRALTLSLEL